MGESQKFGLQRPGRVFWHSIMIACCVRVACGYLGLVGFWEHMGRWGVASGLYVFVCRVSSKRSLVLKLRA